MKFKSKAFNKLRTEWYDKLRESGFKDVEKNDYELIEPSRVVSQEGVDKIEHYYRRATQFLYDYPFQSTRDRGIWFLHTEGVSEIDIAIAFKLDPSQVSRIISAVVEKMFKR